MDDPSRCLSCGGWEHVHRGVLSYRLYSIESSNLGLTGPTCSCLGSLRLPRPDVHPQPQDPKREAQDKPSSQPETPSMEALLALVISRE